MSEFYVSEKYGSLLQVHVFVHGVGTTQNYSNSGICERIIMGQPCSRFCEQLERVRARKTEMNSHVGELGAKITTGESRSQLDNPGEFQEKFGIGVILNTPQILSQQ